MVLLASALIIALALDLLFGEPKKWHPLVGFGCLSQKLENTFNKLTEKKASRALGLVAWTLAVLPPVFVIVLLTHTLSNTPFVFVFHALILYFCIGLKSLHQHLARIVAALKRNDTTKARLAVGMIVSRDTSQLNPEGICKAAIESALENGSDAVFAPIFWFLFFGAPGAILYRLANTLDAMWGYKTERYEHFGYIAAKADDLMNWIPARLVAASYSILGNTRLAIKAWLEQAGQCSSPNAGPVMAAGAGALTIRVGGTAVYHGMTINKPVLGYGKAPAREDIVRSQQLVSRTLLLWVAVLFIIAGMTYAIR